MKPCPFCGLEIDHTELARHYLTDKNLVASIRSHHPAWNPKEGACSRCLETFHREYSSPSIKMPAAEETTVITTAQELIDGTSDEKKGACLVTIHGTNLGKKFDLEKDEMILGRGETADVRINEENISRQHTKIVRRDGEFWAEDLKSTNGTFVNTKK